MRIRKNNKLSSLLLLPTPAAAAAAADDQQLLPTHFCQLNQSPWDVIPFSSYPQHHLHSQFGRDDNGFAAHTGCGSVGSVGRVDSDEKPMVGFGNEGQEIAETDEESSRQVLRIECAKTDGKFWKCKREAKEGHHFCEHHVLQLKSYSGGGVEKSTRVNGVGPGRARAVRKKRSDSSLTSGGSSQYYYYSGFGPLWRKKRGKRPERVSSGNEGSSSYGHFDDESEDDDEDGDKKRVRKPIKARSLKSLM